jgi:hypothetical protein
MSNSNVSNSADVCNQALGAIGHTSFIDDITDQSAEAIACSRFYGQARDEALRSFAWPCAIKHKQPAAIPPASLEGGVVPQNWRFAFALPDGCLRLHGVYPYSARLAADAAIDTGSSTPTQWNDNDFRIWHRSPDVYCETRYVRESDDNVGQIILTDEPQPILEYTRAPGRFIGGVFTEDVKQWDADFVAAVVLNLASKIAGPLKKDTALGLEKQREYAAALSMAASTADQELLRDPEPPPSWIMARY